MNQNLEARNLQIQYLVVTLYMTLEIYSAWLYTHQMIQISSECQSSVVSLGFQSICVAYGDPAVQIICDVSLTPDTLNVTLHPQSVTYNHSYGHNTGKTVKHTSQSHDTLSFLQLSKFFSIQNEELLLFFFKVLEKWVTKHKWFNPTKTACRDSDVFWALQLKTWTAARFAAHYKVWTCAELKSFPHSNRSEWRALRISCFVLHLLY